MRWVKLPYNNRRNSTVRPWHILTSGNRMMCSWRPLDDSQMAETKNAEFTINACSVCMAKHHRRVKNALERSKDGNSTAQ